MCNDDTRALSFETLLSDPLIRLVMESDGVTPRDLVDTLERVRAAVAGREHVALLYLDAVGTA